MAELLHITERSIWEAARESGTYEMSTRGLTLREVGFIHCSLRRQLPAVAHMLYDGWDPAKLVVLVIDSERLSVPVRYEPPEPAAVRDGGGSDDSGDGPGDGDGEHGGAVEEFPHIYGPLPVTAVVDEEPWSWDAPATAPKSRDQLRD
ncbi:DUF952 domain-containing protein [Streptomyces marispadix]|uniref:DUF952 domain-containing protein n=1 Tax=Streptomyces marispadix TaxID=2922868 RepID=A0ABS9STL6_9ACTN|nr:DUF952 domain-containing protein [Streptomyces marispadix]MCH6159612.1 DUF952 domain-containing protein [Streptomyces marispadix]